MGTMYLHAQSSSANPDEVYGYDPLLFNGKVYYYFPQPGTKGSQFLMKEFDSLGFVKLRGSTFTNLNLNYDLFNQKLVLKYRNEISSTCIIEISDAWLEGFELWGRSFEFITQKDTVKRIYQVIGTNEDKILYYFSKELLLDNLKAGGSHYFSEQKKEMYLSRDDKIIGFKNNRSFIRAFSPVNQEIIKKFIHKHSINVKSASDMIMKELIDYCSTLQ